MWAVLRSKGANRSQALHPTVTMDFGSLAILMAEMFVHGARADSQCSMGSVTRHTHTGLKQHYRRGRESRKALPVRSRDSIGTWLVTKATLFSPLTGAVLL